jgi:hypothetical protein
MAASGSMDLALKGCSDHGIALLTGEVVSYLHKLQRKTVGSAAFFMSASTQASSDANVLYSVCWRALHPATRESRWRDRFNLNADDISVAGVSNGAVCASGIAVLQGLVNIARSTRIDVQFLSQASLPSSFAPYDDISTSAASLAGLMRTISQECPQLSSGGFDSSSSSTGVFAIEPVFWHDKEEAKPAGMFSGQGQAERGQSLTTPQLSVSRTRKIGLFNPRAGPVSMRALMPALVTGGAGYFGSVVDCVAPRGCRSARARHGQVWKNLHSSRMRRQRGSHCRPMRSRLL